MSRRVLLLETDERGGLVAALSAVCAERGVSLEISTGPGHVLITFEADNSTTNDTVSSLKLVPGVTAVLPYVVRDPEGEQ